MTNPDVEKILERNKKYLTRIPNFQPEAEEIVKMLSIKYGLHQKTIRLIIASEFRFVKHVMEQCKLEKDEGFDVDEYKSIRLKGLGKFEPQKRFKDRNKK